MGILGRTILHFAEIFGLQDDVEYPWHPHYMALAPPVTGKTRSAPHMCPKGADCPLLQT